MFIKICGMTNEEDALLAIALGADAVGFIFAPSTRQMQPIQVRDIVRRLPPEAFTVGVFRNEVPERVIDIMHTVGLKCAQLHGHETPEQTRAVRSKVGYVIKAFAAGDPALDHFDDYGADFAHVEGATPGSGVLFDWSLFEGAPRNRRVILAGGLRPDNVIAAIQQCRPWGVDLASGVESSPGRKDARLMRDFIKNARSVEENRYVGQGEEPYNWEDDL